MLLFLQTSTKKKVTSKFSFPRTIDMGPRLSAPPVLGGDERGTVYDLSAILVHKGSMVNSGHYVAHIKDDRTNGWWQFDDEQVSSLGFHPLGEVVAQATVTKDLAVREGETIIDTFYFSLILTPSFHFSIWYEFAFNV